MSGINFIILFLTCLKQRSKNNSNALGGTQAIKQGIACLSIKNYKQNDRYYYFYNIHSF